MELMLNGLVKALEKAIQLVGIKQQNKKEYFNLIVSPLFEEFEKVASYYFELFNKRGAPREELLEFREQYIQSRIKVTELAESYKNNVKDEKLLKFFESMTKFFFETHKFPEATMASGGQSFIDILSGESEYAARIAGAKIREEAEKNWGDVVGIYGELKLEYGMPIGFKV